MAWIESHQEVGRHPKTKKLARLLGVSLPAAVGHLHYLWWWALDFAQDGLMEKYDAGDIKDAMLWDGDENQLVDALISSGYIDDTDEGLQLHDWDEYGGKLLKMKMKDRERKRIAKESDGVPQQFRRSSDGKQEETERNPSVHNITQHKKTIQDTTQDEIREPHQPPAGAGVSELQEQRFTEFWKLYPKKVGKPACLKVWKKLRPDTELFEKIIASLSWQKETEQWKKEAGRFIPNPLTWLNQGRWENEPTEALLEDPGTGKSSTLSKLRKMYAEEEGGQG